MSEDELGDGNDPGGHMVQPDGESVGAVVLVLMAVSTGAVALIVYAFLRAVGVR